MRVASDLLEKEVFDAIHQEAVRRERQKLLTEKKPPAPAITPSPKKDIKPHIVQRAEERMNLQLTPEDMAKLRIMIKNGDRNVKPITSTLQVVQELAGGARMRGCFQRPSFLCGIQ